MSASKSSMMSLSNLLGACLTIALLSYQTGPVTICTWHAELLCDGAQLCLSANSGTYRK